LKSLIHALVLSLLVLGGTSGFSKEPAGIPEKAAKVTRPHRAFLPETKAFLQKLNALDDRQRLELSTFSLTGFSTYKKLCLDPATKQYTDCGEAYHSLWIADINNDGKADYVWTDEVEGSGHYDYLEVYDNADGGGIQAVKMPEFKGDYSNIAANLFTVQEGRTYFNLVAYASQDKNGEPLAAGATSNAAEGAYWAVTTEYKCLWQDGKIEVVKRKRHKKKYE